ncbi:MAG: methyltransferase domain-containing protein [Candidatus Hydrogenedentes bacterium]|nr:methyltransferase domain-containing protein [Candidatus Hydrogenedentota bacterium]
MKQDSEYWDGIAPQWTQEIFNSLRNDRNRVIRGELERAARSAENIVDYGCGIGNYLPALARLFKSVHGFDHSSACVEIARKRMQRKRNVSLQQAIGVPRGHVGSFDAAICVNVAINPNRRSWHGVLRSVISLLKPNGQLFLVVPSVESATLLAKATQALPDVNIENGQPASVAPSVAGIVNIEGVRTKHYTRNELNDTLTGLGLQITRIRRIEYSWKCQGVTPPRELRHEHPWDWLAVAKNTGAAAKTKAA